MRIVRKLNTNAGADCKVPMLPVLVQNSVDLAAGDGALASLLAAPLVAGEPAPFGGYVENDLCIPIQVTLTVIHLDPTVDCPEPGCPVPASALITTVLDPIVIDPKTEFELPGAYWSDIQMETLDATEAIAPIVAGDEGSVSLNSCREGVCGCDVVVV